MPGALVALNDGDLQNILRGVDMVGIAVVCRDDLTGDHAEHGTLARGCKVVRREGGDAERVVRLGD